MATIPLNNSELVVEVSEEDHLVLILLGPYMLNVGYARQTAKGKEFVHTLVARRMGISGQDIDHEDRNKMNCTRDNLKAKTHAANMVNQKVRETSVTGHKYISWNTKREKYVVQVLGKHVGYFKTLEVAVRERDSYIKRFDLKVGEV